MSLPPQFLKFKALVRFIDEEGARLHCTLDDIARESPRHFQVIKHLIGSAEQAYRDDLYHETDLRITAVKKAFYSAVKETKR